MTDQPPTLLDSHSPAADPLTTHSTDGLIVFATNRHNLLQVMSSGLLAPRESYDKYYDDLLGLARGRVPLLRTPVGPPVLSLVAPPDDETSFPILIEVDPEWLEDHSRPALTATGERTEARPSGNWSALAYAGVLPRAALRTVHFRSERDLEEHVLREYANVDNTRWDLRVSPDLFSTSETLDPRDWLTVQPSYDFDAQAFRHADAVTGAIAAAAAAAPGTEQSFGAVAAMLNGTDPGKAGGLLRLGLLSPGSSTKPSGADEVLLRVASLELAGLDPDTAWSPTAVLDAVRERVTDFKLSKKDTDVVRKALEAVSDVVGLRADFTPFGERDLASASALQLVLLRPDPDRLLTWDKSETGASQEVRMLAAALAALAQGRIKLPSALRPAALDRRLALLASQPGTASGRPERPGEPAAVISDAEHVRIMSADEVLLEAALIPPTILERLRDLDSADPRWRSVARLLVDQMGWLDCRTVSVTIPATGAAGVRVATDEGGITFDFAQVVAVQTVVDRRRLVARLEETDLPETVRRDLEALL